MNDETHNLDMRVTVLETSMKHIEGDVSEIKSDLRTLSSKLDKYFLWMITVFGGGFVLLAGMIAKVGNWF